MPEKTLWHGFMKSAFQTTLWRKRGKVLLRIQRLNRLRKYAYPALQGLKPLKKTQTLCRAYPSFVRIKRHDPQNLRLFPQPVKPTEKNFAAAGLMVRETHHKSLALRGSPKLLRAARRN